MSILPVPPVERVMFPPVLIPAEVEFKLLVVMSPPVVERAIAPPFPGAAVVVKESRGPAEVLMAPFPAVTLRVIFPPAIPGLEEEESIEPVVMLPPAVERAIAPPLDMRMPLEVSITPVPPVVRVMLPPLVPALVESIEPVVMLPAVVERAIAPPFPEKLEEFRVPAEVLILLVLARVIFPPVVVRLALTAIALLAFNAIAPFPLLVIG
ncbi:hypothetical protein QUB60_25145 [Microcoleus sp. A2-C5]